MKIKVYYCNRHLLVDKNRFQTCDTQTWEKEFTRKNYPRQLIWDCRTAIDLTNHTIIKDMDNKFPDGITEDECLALKAASELKVLVPYTNIGYSCRQPTFHQTSKYLFVTEDQYWAIHTCYYSDNHTRQEIENIVYEKVAEYRYWREKLIKERGKEMSEKDIKDLDKCMIDVIVK